MDSKDLPVTLWDEDSKQILYRILHDKKMTEGYCNHIIVPCDERLNAPVRRHLVDKSEWTGISTDLVKTTPKFDIERNSLKMCKYPSVKDQSIMSVVYDIATEKTYILDGLDAGPGWLVIDESGHFIGIIGYDEQVISAEIINSLYYKIDNSTV